MNEPTAVVDQLVEHWEEMREQGRTLLVEELCREQPELIETVRRKLSALATFGSLANDATGAYASPPSATGIPEKINGYEILDVLGRGGMGVVYKARQPGLGRIVALKILLAGGHASERERKRFNSEAEILAKLRHPGIVQIFEIGETAEGTYLVLEFVEGGSLAKQLDGKPWLANKAANLIEQLAAAVEIAHQAGVVHRDLKPGNVLISEIGIQQSNANDTAIISPSMHLRVQASQAKITDFGIAKRLDGDAELTASGDIVGTPAYMSPEQAAGRIQDTGPASDVYALGAMLYELLTGRPPFNAPSRLDTIMQVVRDEPLRPSLLNPKTPRDLETICLKCLEKEPRKRYVSGAELAEDLRRFQANEPIVARPARWSETAIKWARRNPSRAALFGTLIVGLLTAIAGGTWHTLKVRAERDRAEHNADLALQAVDEMLTEVAEEHLALEPRMEEKRRILLEKALAFYEKLQAENEGNPKLRRQSALGQKRLADILRLLGRSADAERAYRRAIDRLSPLADANANDLDVQRAMADSHNFLGEVLRLQGNVAEARSEYESARQVQEALRNRSGNLGLDVRMDLARTRYNLGLLFKESGDLDQAHRELDASILELRSLTEEDPGRHVFKQHLARGLFNLGTVLRQQNDLMEAIVSTVAAIGILDDLRKQNPRQPDYQHELAVARNNLGNYFARENRKKDAEVEQRGAVELFRILARDFPRIPVYRRELANSLNSLGATLASEKNLDGAKPVWEESARLLEEIIQESGGDPTSHGVLGTTLGNLGKLHLMMKEYSTSCDCLRRGTTHLQAALCLNPEHSDYSRACRNQMKDLSEALIRLTWSQLAAVKF